MPTKQSTSFRLSEDTMDMIRLMADNLGVSQTAVIEMSVREKALKHAREGFETVKDLLANLSPEMKVELKKRADMLARERDI